MIAGENILHATRGKPYPWMGGIFHGCGTQTWMVAVSGGSCYLPHGQKSTGAVRVCLNADLPLIFTNSHFTSFHFTVFFKSKNCKSRTEILRLFGCNIYHDKNRDNSKKG